MGSVNKKNSRIPSIEEGVGQEIFSRMDAIPFPCPRWPEGRGRERSV